MKKTAKLPFLAVSALSLGVVGLSTLAPIAHADPSNTLDSVFTVHVEDGAGIDPNPDPSKRPEGLDDNNSDNIANVNLTLKPVSTGARMAWGAVVNTTGNAGTLTVTDKDADLNLKAGDNKQIAPIAKTGKLNTTTASWGLFVGKGDATSDFSPVPAAGAQGLVIDNNITGSKSFVVTYGASSDNATGRGDYTDTLVYTYTPGA